jgi:lipopolysaccharide/colanic/teichoic acid biosynthesis glycosyltransferase
MKAAGVQPRTDDRLSGPLATQSSAAVRPREPALKRPFDAMLAGIGLMLSAPLWLAIAAAIKLEDGGPLLYVQERWGRYKVRFRAFKFRSMVPNADRDWGAVQATEDDPRITRVGRFLRATALDEMPQLLNILKGDMSFVGPRALPLNEIQARETSGHVPDERIPGFEERQSVRPGLTGVAQVYAPRDVPRAEKFRHDLLYVKNQSFLLDLRLILLSFLITFRARWEQRGSKV